MSVALIEDRAQTPEVAPNPPKVNKYTGEILLRTRPKTYRKVIQLLAEGIPVLTIMRQCRVGQGMVEAIRERHAATISERKEEIVTLLTDVSHIGAARMMDTVGKAKLRDASIATGIAVQRTLELLGQSPTVQIANVIMPSDADRDERRALHDKLDAITARLNAQP